MTCYIPYNYSTTVQRLVWSVGGLTLRIGGAWRRYLLYTGKDVAYVVTFLWVHVMRCIWVVKLLELMLHKI